MKTYSDKRHSHCVVCGDRLSSKTRQGDILWHPSQVDDKGIYCLSCYDKKTYDRAEMRNGMQPDR